MKKLLMFATAAMVLFASCQKESMPEKGMTSENGIRQTITVALDDNATKTALGTELEGKVPVVWKAGDKIAVIENFQADPGQKCSIYVLESGEGTSQGTFRYESGDANPAIIKTVLYPASAINTAGAIPNKQAYVQGSFDPEALTMLFNTPDATEQQPIVLKNMASVVCVPVAGREGDKVKAVEIRVAKSESYQVEAPQGIALSSAPVPFYVVVPARTAEQTVTAYVHMDHKSIQTRSTKKFFKAGQLHRFAPWTLGRKASWNLLYTSSTKPTNHTDAANGVLNPWGWAQYMTDDNDLSWWNYGSGDKSPFIFIYDLSKTEQIRGIRLVARKVTSKVRQPHTVNVSFVNEMADPTKPLEAQWSEPVTFENTEKSIDWQPTLASSVQARYIKLEIKGSWNDSLTKIWTGGSQVAEFDIL